MSVYRATTPSADWARLPHDLIDRVSRRIVGEVRVVNRDVFDVTSKPPRRSF